MGTYCGPFALGTNPISSNIVPAPPPRGETVGQFVVDLALPPLSPSSLLSCCPLAPLAPPLPLCEMLCARARFCALRLSAGASLGTSARARRRLLWTQALKSHLS